ncbi:MAG: pilus assembly protein [Hyphomicrobiaceae bacterium]|nr:MAG: pilus assembly protein [Hyphomicrobiaceae bacterium]
MVPGAAELVRRKCAGAWMLARRVRKDEDGNSTVEFAMIAMPFLMLLVGIMSICLYFFTNFTIENAVWQAARAIRTGQLQQSQGSYAGITTLEDQKIAFKNALCAKAPTFLDCANKAVVLVQSNASFSGIVEPACASNGTIVDQSTASFDPGTASSVVLVTVCYPWQFGGKLPFFKLGNLKDGSLLMQASAAFRTEPYN